MIHLSIAIDAGEKTCARAPGEFCSQLRVQRFGSRFVCALFDRAELRDDNGVLSGPGWLQRLPKCVESTVSNA
jgi:hypothetical protein